MELIIVNKFSVGFAVVKKSDYSLDELLKEVKKIKGVIRIDDEDGSDDWYVHGGSREAVERIFRHFGHKQLH